MANHNQTGILVAIFLTIGLSTLQKNWFKKSWDSCRFCSPDIVFL
jgi:hypothetical protein